MSASTRVAALTRRGLIAGSAAAVIALRPGRAMADVSAYSHARAIAEAIAALPFTAPEDITARVGWTLADAFASILYATTLADAMAGARYLANGRSEAIVPAAGYAAAAPHAAAASAYLLHAAEIDDSDLRGQLRASAVVLSAALAAAQATDSRGGEFVRAAALGYTLQGRFAAPVGPIQGRGWMASGVWGPPAAAAAVAMLCRLGIDETEAAIALAAAGAGGLFQYYFDQSDEKRLIVARAARAAVESAGLAVLGERGAARVIEGRAGLYALFGGGAAPDTDHFTRNLEALEGPLFVRPKYFAASHSIIPTLDGLVAVAPKGVAAEQVERIIVRGDPAWGAVIGDKINSFEPPRTRIGAALNFSYVIALWIVNGRVLPMDYTQAALRDKKVLSLARLASYENAPGENLSIEIALKNAPSIRAAAIDPAPDAPAPLDKERRLAKFHALAQVRLSSKSAAQLLAHCLDVANARSMRSWMTRAQAICG